ncbi:POTRA domain-containing protein [Spongiimicrobium sp. 2-473A-2-J]|uniref:POTRA domain-containing protein n=1 Tax=Eudoraea algarum TaxID=3417568 RepID=UPI003D36E637
MGRKLLVIMILWANGMFSQEPAERQKIQEIQIEGLKRTKENFLRRLIKVKPNSVYDSLKVVTDVERLKRLPGIASASYDLEQEQEGYVLTYTVVENFTIIPGLRIATANNGDFAFRVSVFEFNLLGNNQLLGGFYERDVFDSYGFFWEHPFLFSDKVGVGFAYQDLTTQEPVFFDAGTKDYRFNSRSIEGKLLFSFDFHHEAELGLSLIKESYDFIGEDENILPDTPFFLEANKVAYQGVYRYVDLDIDYQYFDGITSEFTGQYIQFVNGSDQASIFLDDFLSLRNDLIYYKKIRSRGNWASRLRVAAAFGNEDSPFAPFTLDNQLNIRGVGNTVDRGTAAIVLNTEYRHTFYERNWFVLQGNAFVDAGSWRNPGGDFSELFDGSTARVYPGVGIRFIHKRIFNAVFRLDYGFGLTKNATNGIVFGIGQYF